MKIRSFAVMLAASAAATAAPAFAQDEDGPYFTGVRFEARAGLDSFSGRIAMTDPDDEDETITVSSTRDKLGYGAELGYDHQLGPVVVGAYAGIENSGTSHCQAIVDDDDLGCLESGRNLYAGARAGVVIADTILVYGRGGYSRGRYSLAYDADTDVGNPTWAIADSAGGYHYGGGLEMAFTPNFYGRVEYVRTRYGRLEAENPLDDDLAVGIRTRRSQVTAGLGLRF